MRTRLILLSGLALLVLCPLAGGWWRGLPPGFLNFPPLIHFRPEHASFSWLVFSGYALLFLVAAAILVRPWWFGFSKPGVVLALASRSHPFPGWGWAGLALNLTAWICAWSRFEWLGVLKDHTFFPLWLGYILTVDGLVYHRRGASLLSRSPFQFALLFPASSLTWWYFEYINRFVENWWYAGEFEFTAWHYIGHATLCFSTVLPAVFETHELLGTFSWFQSAYAQGLRTNTLSRPAQWGVLSMGTLGLVLLALRPESFFCLTWLAPMAVLAVTLSRAGIRTPFGAARSGNYGPLCTLAVAALVCGFFWELWNFWSLPKWHYQIPFVGRFHLFEMPVVGFAGYLPFGPLCACFWLVLANLMYNYKYSREMLP